MANTTWVILSDKGGEYHSAHFRGLFLEVSRKTGSADVVGIVFTKAPEDAGYKQLERFTERRTIEDAKARVLRVANRHLDTADIQ